MAGGNREETSSNVVIENDDEGSKSNFDDARKVSKSTNPNNKSGIAKFEK